MSCSFIWLMCVTFLCQFIADSVLNMHSLVSDTWEYVSCGHKLRMTIKTNQCIKLILHVWKRVSCILCVGGGYKDHLFDVCIYIYGVCRLYCMFPLVLALDIVWGVSCLTKNVRIELRCSCISWVNGLVDCFVTCYLFTSSCGYPYTTPLPTMPLLFPSSHNLFSFPWKYNYYFLKFFFSRQLCISSWYVSFFNTLFLMMCPSSYLPLPLPQLPQHFFVYHWTIHMYIITKKSALASRAWLFLCGFSWKDVGNDVLPLAVL